MTSEREKALSVVINQAIVDGDVMVADPFVHRRSLRAELQEVAGARAVPSGFKYSAKPCCCCGSTDETFMAAWTACPTKTKTRCLSHATGACCACLCGDAK
jgi:hypothetical protein